MIVRQTKQVWKLGQTNAMTNFSGLSFLDFTQRTFPKSPNAPLTSTEQYQLVFAELFHSKSIHMNTSHISKGSGERSDHRQSEREPIQTVSRLTSMVYLDHTGRGKTPSGLEIASLSGVPMTRALVFCS